MRPTVIPVLHRIRGPLQVDTLKGALASLVQRHDALRSSFHASDGLGDAVREYARTRIVPRKAYVQRIADTVQVDLRIQESGALPDFIGQELDRDFERSESQRMRTSLFRVSEKEAFLLIVLDHLIADGWSVRLVERELRRLYALGPGSLESTAPSFADFAEWQNEWIEKAQCRKSIAYWLRRWAEFGDARLRIGDFPHASAAPGTEAQQHSCTLEPEIVHNVRTSLERHRLSLFMLFLAAWALVLHRCTGRGRFPVWSHFNNRARPETQELVGYVINTHILGLDLETDSTGHELFSQVRRVVLEAAAHQAVPLPQCWRVTGVAPRFDDAFVMLEVRQGRAPSDPDLDDAPVQISRVRMPDLEPPRLSKLGLYVTDDEDRIEVAAVFDRQLFDPDVARRIPEQVCAVLRTLIADPGKKLSELRTG